MKKLKVFLSESKNPHLNIATEEWIFDNLDPSQQVLFLWQNEETVVIGRNQNPWNECNLAKMKEDKVHLARRKTGGGAVFHDLGNICFTFLSPREEYKRENNVQIIFNALKELGITGEASGRNDLLIPFPDGPRKFSGSAYREKKDRAFHHGTLLLHADLTRLGNYLTPNPKKLQAKGKESVRARVANLNEVRPGIEAKHIVEYMVPAFERFYDGKADIEMLSLATVNKNAELKGHYDQLSSWEWLYGNTLEFTHKMDEYLSLGFFDFQFKVEDGVIKDVHIYTDCLYPSLVDELTTRLKGQPYRGDSVKAAIEAAKTKHPDLIAGVSELGQWLLKNIEI
ncbi:lipoate--protein ligase [Bdellovibrio bacteriovorus]|uniref:lipoate--protein ligase n=1 Tax=Bdellovibrio bacteriovorus TaxID=959 RepID=A0A150WDK3_BDEBC|nr:lipoate--protein ligase [Bdellovibrio bacteriovorus]KYG60952.1 lipoate--protein ligase [Bdellovibrio bacteriovorus]